MNELDKLAALRSHVIDCHPMESIEGMRHRDFDATYRERSVFRTQDVRHMVERTHHIVHCEACIEVETFGQVEAIRYFTAYEEDPLRNHPSILNLQCYNCGHTLAVPMPYEPPEFVTLRDIKQQLGDKHPVYRGLVQRVSGRRWTTRSEATEHTIAKDELDQLMGEYKAKEEAEYRAARKVVDDWRQAQMSQLQPMQDVVDEGGIHPHWQRLQEEYMQRVRDVDHRFGRGYNNLAAGQQMAIPGHLMNRMAQGMANQIDRDVMRQFDDRMQYSNKLAGIGQGSGAAKDKPPAPVGDTLSKIERFKRAFLKGDPI